MGEWLGEEEHIERLLTAKKVTLLTPMIVMIKYIGKLRMENLKGFKKVENFFPV